jgi:sugar phosphate isomerase/epimerase
MKLSIVLSTQPASFSALAYKGELETNIQKIAELGYDGVELAVRDPKLLDLPAINALLDRHNLEVPAIGTGQAYGEDRLSFTSPDEGIRQAALERIKTQVDLASHLNAVVLIGLIRGKVEEAVNQTQAGTWLVDALKESCSQAAAKDVRLAMEPINRYETDLFNTVEESLRLLEQVGADNFGLLLDTFHMNIEEPSIEASIRMAGDRIFHFHVADSNRWHPGAGHIDFHRLLEVLHGTGYRGYVSAEILPLPDPDTCAERTIATIQPIIKRIDNRLT